MNMKDFYDVLLAIVNPKEVLEKQAAEKDLDERGA